MSDLAAVVLAGGAGRRMGGAAKAAIPVGGVALLTRVLRAVSLADPVVVVGPPTLASLIPDGVRLTQETPPGAGPVAAARAGFSLVGAARNVALLATDLPLLTPGVVGLLRARLDATGAHGAIVVDDAHRPQWLCGVWVRDRLAPRLTDAPDGASVQATVDGLDVELVTVQGRPWFDCDTEDDLRRAEEWTHADVG